MWGSHLTEDSKEGGRYGRTHPRRKDARSVDGGDVYVVEGTALNPGPKWSRHDKTTTTTKKH